MRIKLLLIAAILAAVISVGSVLIGFEIGFNRLGPDATLEEIDRRITQLVRYVIPAPEQEPTSVRQSALLVLNSEYREIPEEMEWGTGGGMTVIDEHALLLTESGTIYAIRSPDEIIKTSVIAPDNGMADLLRMRESEFGQQLKTNPNRLRFNDILYTRNQGKGNLLLSYTRYFGAERCYRNVVSKMAVESADALLREEYLAESWSEVFRSEPCLPLKQKYESLEGHMAGGRMAESGHGTVYLTSGDFHFDGMRSDPDGYIAAQDPTGHYGKVLELDVATGEANIVSSGHRNAQGIVTHGTRTFVVEHGPRGGDELNLLSAGSNYGWPLESYGVTYKGVRIPNSLSFARHDNFEKPLYAWVPSIAASAAIAIERFHEHWAGDLLIGSIRDKGLHRVRLEDDRVVYVERIPFGERVRSLVEHPNGNLLVWTDERRVHFLTPDETGREFENLAASVQKVAAEDEVKASRLHEALMSCAECHSFAYGSNEKAPSLSTIYQNNAGSTDFAAYSAELKRSELVWTRENLIEFLMDPQEKIPGTSMPNPAIDRDIAEGIAQVLESFDAHF